jgi:hypothetical protein
MSPAQNCRYRTTVIGVLTTLCAIGLSACSSSFFQRMGFMMTEQQACMKRNEDHPFAAARDAECQTSTRPNGMSYEEYEAERHRTTGTND